MKLSTALKNRPEVTALAVEGGTPVSGSMIAPVGVEVHEDDISAAVGVLRSGMLAAGGRAKAFEEAFASATGAGEALACANGTCALQLAYGALIEPGDHVLVPAWTYIATASMLVAQGAVPIFVDADPLTYQIDVDDARAKVTEQTTAIAATHLYGCPVDIGGVEALAGDRALSVVYDAAQAHLASYDGQGIGAFGDALTYSFYATKNMTTGEGGMVTTNDADLAKRMRLLRSHGESEKYLHTSVGFNYRMTDVEAAIGLSQLGRLASVTARRQAIAERYNEALASIDGLEAPGVTQGAQSVYHLYPVRLDPDAFAEVDGGVRGVRDMFAEALRAEGVAAAIHYPYALTQQPAFASMVRGSCPVAERLADTLVCVPVHHKLSDEEVGRVIEAMAKVARALRA